MESDSRSTVNSQSSSIDGATGAVSAGRDCGCTSGSSSSCGSTCGGLANLRVTGEQFVSSLKGALLEIDLDDRYRDEIMSLSQFLVAFYTGDQGQTLTEAQLKQLTFTVCIESVDRTRRCLFDLFETGPDLSEVRKIDGGFLVPTDTFVAYLCTRAYYKEGSDGKRIEIRFLADNKDPTHSQGGGRHRSTWRRRDTVRANFLHFLVNMFARQVPGNLMYSLDSGETAEPDDRNDFFACAKFLQENLLVNPINFAGIYEHIWETYQRLASANPAWAKAEDLQLYCQPIVCSKWSITSVQKYSSGIDKKSFIQACLDAIL